MTKPNIALVGAGYWGKNLARNLYELSVLKTICDSSRDTRDKMDELYPETTLTDDYREVLQDKSIEGIFVATPAVKHYELAKEALETGKHVFVEKPLALTMHEGKELVLKYDAPQDCKMLQLSENIKSLTEFSQDFFQRELKIRFKIRGTGDAAGNDQNNSTPQEDRRALGNDPLVQMTTDVLDGEVSNIRTGPRSR